MIWLARELWPYLLLAAVLGAGVTVLLATVGGTTERWVGEQTLDPAAAVLQAGLSWVAPDAVPPTGGFSASDVPEPENAWEWADELGGPLDVVAASPHDSPFPPWSGSDPAPWELEEEWSQPGRARAVEIDDFPYAAPVEAPLPRT